MLIQPFFFCHAYNPIVKSFIPHNLVLFLHIRLSCPFIHLIFFIATCMTTCLQLNTTENVSLLCNSSENVWLINHFLVKIKKKHKKYEKYHKTEGKNFIYLFLFCFSYFPSPSFELLPFAKLYNLNHIPLALLCLTSFDVVNYIYINWITLAIHSADILWPL